MIRNTLEHMYNITPEMTAASKPLTMDAYLTFFIIPLLAASFIAKDEDTNVEGGWESMVREDTDRHPSMKVDKFLEVVRTSNSVRCNKHAMVAPTSSEGNNKENDDPLVSRITHIERCTKYMCCFVRLKNLGQNLRKSLTSQNPRSRRVRHGAHQIRL